ncbi:MAG: STM3941 family protein [Paracoccus sp. (in: a-proteobacteria)]|nr:STM3941 family protein [Paracoccus sp. (in: a-proteobacteria)]
MTTNILDEPLVVPVSPAQILTLSLLGLLMAGLSGVAAFGWLGSGPAGLLILIGWIGLIFFGATTIAWARRGLLARNMALTMDRNGLHDPRVAARPIPWLAIEDAYTWSMSGQNVLVLQVPAETEAAIGLTWIARMTRKPNKRLGADGLAITAAGLRMGYPELVDAVVSRVMAARMGRQDNADTADVA